MSEELEQTPELEVPSEAETADVPEISAADLGLSSEPADESLQEAEDGAVETETPQESQESVQEVASAQRSMPQSWKKEWEQHWTGLSPEVQEIFETREKQMSEGVEQLKQYSGLGQQINEVVAPYSKFLEQQGVDAPKALHYLLNAHYRLSNGTPEEKQQWFDYLAQSYGLQPKGEQVEVDPAVKALQDQISGIQQNLTQAQQAEMSRRHEEAAKEVEAFAADKPYFDEVADHIVAFINAGDNLEDAYDKAVWANPVTREKELARVQTEKEQEFQKKAKAEAEAAKKAAGTNVRSRDTRKTPTEPLGTMEDTMKETLKEIRGRVH